jgi:hypothetical protein
MKKLIIILLLAGGMLGAKAQTAGSVKDTIHYSDTTINKVFFTWSINMPNLYEKKVAVNMFVYLSKGSLHNMSKTISVPEIPNYFEIDLSTDGNKTLDQIIDPLFIRNLIRSKLKELNPTWQNADFTWY